MQSFATRNNASSPRRSWAAASIAFLCLASSGAVSADTLNPGSVLTISFTAAPNASDLLVFGSGFGMTATGSPTVTTSLFNGATLLGIANAPVLSFFGQQYFDSTFEKPGSQYTFGPPITVDFTSINNGTIDGKLVLTVTGGSVDYQQNFYLQDAESCGTDCYTPKFNLGITRYDLSSAGPSSAPEPASFCLAGAALSTLFFLRRRKAASRIG